MFEKVGVRAVVENVSGYQNAAGQIEASNKRLGQSAVAAGEKSSGFGKALKAIGTIATGVIAARGMMMIPQILGGITSTARDLELQMKKANIVFGEQIGVVEDWAAANAHAMGLTRREAVAAGAAFADLLIPMGFTREAATEMTTSVLGLSGALAEWSGGTRSAAEVSRILAKAMLGEREQLKELGISITEAEVQGRLLEKGQKDLTGAMLQQAKAVATQELLFEKSTDAQTAYAEGAGSAARKQAELTAAFSEAKEEVALALAPAIGELLSLATKLTPAVAEGSKAFGALVDVVGRAVSVLIEIIAVAWRFKEALLAIGLAFAAIKVAAFIGEVMMLIRAFGAANVAAATLGGTLGPIGLILAAAGAAAALFGLSKVLGDTAQKAKVTDQAVSDLTTRLEHVHREAQRRGLDPEIEDLKQLAREYEHSTLALKAYEMAMKTLASSEDRSAKNRVATFLALKQLDDERLREVALLDESRARADALNLTYEQLVGWIGEGNISVATAIALFPDFAAYLREIGRSGHLAGEGLQAAAVGTLAFITYLWNMERRVGPVSSEVNKIKRQAEEMGWAFEGAGPPIVAIDDAASGVGAAAAEAAEQVRDLGEALSEAFTEDILAGLEAVPAGIREIISGAGEALEAFSASWRPQMEELFIEIQDLAVLGPEVPESYRVAAEAMGGLEDVVVYVGAALANQRQEQAALAAVLWEAEFIYDELADGVQRYTDEIEEANDSLRRFANAQLEGTAAFDEAMFALEQAISRKRLEIVNAELAGNEEAAERLREELGRLRLEAEALDLQREIETAPLERQIESLVDDTEELTFEEIIAGIKEAKARIEDAEPKLEDLNDLLGIQEGKVSDAKEAFDKQGETIGATEKLYEQLVRTLGTFEQTLAQETDAVLGHYAWIMWKTNETGWTFEELSKTVRYVLQPALDSINTSVGVGQMNALGEAARNAISAANTAMATAGGIAMASYQFGGIVAGRMGQPQLAVVHGGERITPPALSLVAPMMPMLPAVASGAGANIQYIYGGVGIQGTAIARYPQTDPAIRAMQEWDRLLR